MLQTCLGNEPHVKGHSFSHDDLTSGHEVWAVLSDESERVIAMGGLADENDVGDIELVGLCVHERCRRRGYGTMILQSLVQYLNITSRLHQLRCEVYEFRKGSIQFYRKTGFVPFGVPVIQEHGCRIKSLRYKVVLSRTYYSIYRRDCIQYLIVLKIRTVLCQ